MTKADLINNPDDRFIIENKEPQKTTDYKSRLQDMIVMRNLEICPRYQVVDLLLELNLRLMQYIKQFPYNIETLIAQTLADFKKEIAASDKEILIDRSFTRTDFMDGMQKVFVYELLPKETGQKTMFTDDGNGHEIEIPSEDDIPF